MSGRWLRITWAMSRRSSSEQVSAPPPLLSCAPPELPVRQVTESRWLLGEAFSEFAVGAA